MSAGFAALILMTAFAVAGFLYQQHGSDAVRHTIEVDGRLARALSALQDAETGQRGYVISGDEAFLAPLPGRPRRLQPRPRPPARPRPRQSRAARPARPPARPRGPVRRGTRRQRRPAPERRRGGSARLVREGQGKRSMDAIRALIRAMEAHEPSSSIPGRRWSPGSPSPSGSPWRPSSCSSWCWRPPRSARPGAGPTSPASSGGTVRPPRRRGRQPARRAAAERRRGLRGHARLHRPRRTLDPHALSQFLTAFRRRVMRVARLRGGVVDKFIGDGALIVFGLPEPRPDDAARALAFARDLVAVIERWNAGARTGAPIRIGVGIHYGDLFCGIIGEDMRLEFTGARRHGERRRPPGAGDEGAWRPDPRLGGRPGGRRRGRRRRSRSLAGGEPGALRAGRRPWPISPRPRPGAGASDKLVN